MIPKRSSGILAHITSLPSSFGIGDLGPSSKRFIDFLVDCNQSYWQFLPTGPTNDLFDNSPYMSTSAFAGSAMLISPEMLFAADLISQISLEKHQHFSPYTTNFHEVRTYKDNLLAEAFLHFNAGNNKEYLRFIESSTWLDDYASFMVLKEIYKGSGWFSWPRDLATRNAGALRIFLEKNSDRIDYYRFEQYEFYRQWNLLHQYAIDNGVQLIGDLPIYVSYDSVDVWAHQRIFVLDRNTLKPVNVAGVPPDYFSATGQRWGNPLYDWHSKDPTIQDELISWWSRRLSHIFSQVDITRIDHFRGFESFWAIPEQDETAVGGEWIKGPGLAFFQKLTETLGSLNIIAEDLGIITPEVEELRDKLGLPGMKVLQFAFDGNPDNSFLPYNYKTSQCVVYTGTHDNDTTVGWFLSDKIDDTLRTTIKRATNRSLHDQTSIHHDLMYLAQSSIAILCVFPLQDILGFGNDCKMNSPGVAKGNWRWRCAEENLSADLAKHLADSTKLFGRSRTAIQSNFPKKL